MLYNIYELRQNRYGNSEYYCIYFQCGWHIVKNYFGMSNVYIIPSHEDGNEVTQAA